MATLAHDVAAKSRKRPGGVSTAVRNLRRRRTYLIDAKTQLTITRQFVVVLLAASALSIGNYHVFRTMLAVEVHDSVDRWMTYGYCLVLVGISVALLFLLCVFFSHRIAGPARKLCQSLGQMANRDLCVRVRLRDSDLLTELADAVNDANQDLRTALLEIEAELGRARAAAGDPEKVRGCLERAQRLLGEFHLREGEAVDAREALSRSAVAAAGARTQAAGSG